MIDEDMLTEFSCFGIIHRIIYVPDHYDDFTITVKPDKETIDLDDGWLTEKYGAVKVGYGDKTKTLVIAPTVP